MIINELINQNPSPSTFPIYQLGCSVNQVIPANFLYLQPVFDPEINAAKNYPLFWEGKGKGI
jgi:hypothetical protein